MRMVDVRHEATAVFAAEGSPNSRADPDSRRSRQARVTNGISGITSACFNGIPMVVVGGRAPEFRWGTGALQEIDHIPLVAPVTKRGDAQGPEHDRLGRRRRLRRGHARAPGRPSSTYRWIASMLRRTQPCRIPFRPIPRVPDPDSLTAVADLLAAAETGAGAGLGCLDGWCRGYRSRRGGVDRPAGRGEQDGSRHPAAGTRIAGLTSAWAGVLCRPTW